MQNIIILYPSDFFNKKKIDECYEFELNYLKEISVDYIFFNFDEFIGGSPIKLFPDNKKDAIVIYRGWMLSSEKYLELYNYLKKYNLILINDVSQYENCHQFPLSYPLLKEYTPEIVIYNSLKEIDWKLIKNKFNKFMIKDYVKSIKDSRFPDFFNDTYSDEELNNYMEEFIKLRGALFVNGFVFKDYVNLKKYNGKTNEYRCFFLYGKLITFYKNSDQDNDASIIDENFIKSLPVLNSNFYTIDLAELEDGNWTIIETGDGQVSGIPTEVEAKEFYLKLIN